MSLPSLTMDEWEQRWVPAVPAEPSEHGSVHLSVPPQSQGDAWRFPIARDLLQALLNCSINRPWLNPPSREEPFVPLGCQESQEHPAMVPETSHTHLLAQGN